MRGWLSSGAGGRNAIYISLLVSCYSFTRSVYWDDFCGSEPRVTCLKLSAIMNCIVIVFASEGRPLAPRINHVFQVGRGRHG